MADSGTRFSRGGLLGILIAVAALVFAVVALQTAQLMAGVGAPLSWRTVALTQGAFLLGWALWAGFLVWIAPRWLDGQVPPGRAALVIGALVVLPAVIVPAVALPVHRMALVGDHPWPASWVHMASHNALTNLLLGAAMVGLTWGYLNLARARALEVRATALQGELATAQLDTLRAQLNPHFLFNALNSVAVLARRGDGAAVDAMVTELAALLRHSLETSRAQVVTLGVELAALRHYLAIEQVRYGERLAVSIAVPESLLGRLVPSFVLQPLVENAIRHGFPDPAHVLHLAIAAHESAGLVLTVRDDGTGPAVSAGDGVGLGHTRARLAGLYGGGASLAIEPGVDGRGTLVTISLPAASGAEA